jgi:hypothetical protein
MHEEFLQDHQSLITQRKDDKDLNNKPNLLKTQFHLHHFFINLGPRYEPGVP